jgi:hypothetical protein
MRTVQAYIALKTISSLYGLSHIEGRVYFPKNGDSPSLMGMNKNYQPVTIRTQIISGRGHYYIVPDYQKGYFQAYTQSYLQGYMESVGTKFEVFEEWVKARKIYQTPDGQNIYLFTDVWDWLMGRRS